ncbi:MAG: ankyrin repeat domain-containing protein [Roseofilum sp. SBFL]|uniref:ankyrin repeat domain-containing protein n=1 Tax=unclassified Roseofilum TaxID=2620099 RepID=UPI001B070D29|nr:MULTISPECIES: ankyrin repeat domain-containing protein [unclassified Roseofilum]MBP0015588.1 ankyrin repeat domain-containing protein [Roseofilum sp. SID3]MBP0022685.1 ankyrin repeat domain-containing protein [Roseofilum sp. SID2]MBP0039245.1 ankyrin repeat domain-containing protein [Roseofilum sp. SID1]MBP0042673.1 ankyrin repeat domain-containing protein [Roseofilum sp. SBFL]
MNKERHQSEYSLYEIINLARDESIQEIYRLVSLNNSMIHIQDENGTTLLMEASGQGNFELVKLLVDAGADPNQIDIMGFCALLYSAQEEYWEIFEYLFNLTNQGLKESSLFMSTVHGELKVLQALIDKKVSVDAYRQKGVWSKNGCTALILTVQEGRVDIVKSLLKAGANPNLAEEDTGGTPLMYAAKNGYLEILDLLLEAGADPTIRDYSNETALMKAEKFNNIKIWQT